MSLVSAFNSFQGGQAGNYQSQARAIDAGSRGRFAQQMGEMQATSYMTQGNFDRVMFESASLLVDRKASVDQSALIRDFEEQAKQNMAAMAVSGLAMQSFDGITEGNQREMGRASKEIERNADDQKGRNKRNADMAMSSAEKSAEMARVSGNIQNIDAQFAAFSHKVEGKMALYAGIGDGLATLYKAEQSYQENHTKDQSRFDFFKKSVGFS
jgi:hypothetical protein